jgi:hypothetical protein
MGFSVRLKRDSVSFKNNICCPLKKYSVSFLTIIHIFKINSIPNSHKNSRATERSYIFQ